MNDMRKILFIGLLIFGLSGQVFASASKGITENGITGTETVSTPADSTIISYGEFYTKEMSRFNAYDIPDSVGTDTYIYTAANGTSATSGSVNVKGLDELDEMLNVSSLAGGTITAKIDFGIGSNTVWYGSVTVTFVGTNSTEYIPVQENPDRIRIGWKKSVLGSATVTSISSYKGNVK